MNWGIAGADRYAHMLAVCCLGIIHWAMVLMVHHEIMVLFFFRKLILPTRIRSQLSSGAKCLMFGRTLRLLPYFMCADSEAGETARMHRLAWAFAGWLCDKYHNLMSWLHWCVLYAVRPILFNSLGSENGQAWNWFEIKLGANGDRDSTGIKPWLVIAAARDRFAVSLCGVFFFFFFGHSGFLHHVRA